MESNTIKERRSAESPVFLSAHHMPSSGGPPPISGRRPPPAGPPPIPSRVDLGEAPVDAASSTKKQSRDDLPNKGSPKLKTKGRPEITIMSARPMDSTGVIPPPSVTSPSAPEIPKVPQKPSRKPKGREPPPRPKSRPVSELTLGTDEQDEGLVAREGEQADRELPGNTSESKVLQAPIIVPRVPSPVVPPHKVPGEKSKATDVSEENSNLSPDEESELTRKAEREVVKDVHAVKKPVATKPTIVRAKPKESTENDSKPSGEVEGMKETRLNSNSVSVDGVTTMGKKIKPTVIIAPKPNKKKEPETDAQKGKDEGKEPSNAKPTMVTVSQGGKPPPPAKKPKPPVKAKPSSSLETPSKPSTAEEDKPETTVVSKPRMRPTVIVAKPPKVSDAAKPDEESSKSKEESQARLKPTAAAAPVEAKQEAHDEEKTATASSVKPKCIPTIIRAAPWPDAQDTGEERKPPKRPQRGPSIRAPPRRPVSAPAEENKEQEKVAVDGQDKPAAAVSEQVTETAQEKVSRPLRPVSIPAVKDNKTLKDVKKIKEAASPVEESTAMTRKGSRKRPPPPRPPTVEPVGEKVDSTSEIQNKTEDLDEKSKVRTRAPAPRPPAVESAGEKVDSTSETHGKMKDLDEKSKGKTRPPPPRPLAVNNASDKDAWAPEILHNTAPQDGDGKSKKKNRPSRPASKVLDDKPSKHLHEETEESRRQEKPKPARPAPVALNESSVMHENVHEAETRTMAESTRDVHVQETSGTRDSAQEVGPSTAKVHEKEKSEKASSMAKPKPARPPSSTSSTKNKPHRPSAPVAKPSKEAAAPTQVSSVCKTYIEPSAIALYDYEPTAIDDLSFNAGDEIVLLKRIDDEWYIGRLGDHEGMFPVKFVEIIEDLPQEKEPETKPAVVPESSPFDVMSLYDFHGNKEDEELVFATGETIHVIGKINDDWLKGEYLGKTGAFPCGFVDISAELIDKLPQSEPSETVSKSSQGECNELELDLYCKALFDFISDVPVDLSFHAGDIIKIKKKVGEEWFEGEINGHVGMFPAAYVEMVKDVRHLESQPDETEHHVIEYGTALYDFTGTATDELSFKKGDKLEITERVSEDWLRGKHSGREGMLPRAFVQLATVEPEPALQCRIKSGNLTPKAKALFDFDGDYEDELSFRTGDVIVLLERVNDEWFQGELNKKVGRFPAAFVEILTPLS